MPLRNLYRITDLEQAAGRITGTLLIDAAHPVFEGHFPGSSVLPGVVQLEMVKTVLSQALGNRFALKDMSNCKFLEVLNPTETPELTIQIQYKGDELLDVDATGRHGEKTYFKARGNFHSII